jgi:hypothetical protein
MLKRRMTEKTSNEIGSAGLRWAVAVTLFCAVLLPGVAGSAEPVGRVVSARGAVFAQAPGEERRILQCRDPIYEGDRVLTLDGSGVGIDAGSYYVRLGENTTTEMGALASGAPRVDLVSGHLRLIDSAGGSGPSAELSTPGLRVARTGSDQDALVFAEKAGTVSMVCAYGGDIQVARLADPLSFLAALSGGCVVAKPREALFSAAASHPELAVLMRDACDELAMVPVAGHFSPSDVGLGPALAGVGGGAPVPAPPAWGAGPTQPCSGGCARSAGAPSAGPGLPTQFPFVPPVLPPAPTP